MVVKKTLYYTNVFFYNHLCQPPRFYKKRIIVAVVIHLRQIWKQPAKQTNSFFLEYMADKKDQIKSDFETADQDESLDRGGRRRLPDRRQFSSSDHFPERRNLRHRRSGSDRRRFLNLKVRKKLERRQMFKEKYSDK